MVKTVKIGEIQTEMIGDINTTDVMNVFLRIGWGAETTSRIAFKPAEDLKTGDGIRVIIEKEYEEPEPEEEKEATVDEVSEPLGIESKEEAAVSEVDVPLETEGKEEVNAEIPEPSKAEDKKEATVDEIPETTSEAEGGGEGTAEKI